MSVCGTCGRSLSPTKMRCTACGAYTTAITAGGSVGENDFVDACDVKALTVERIVTDMWWDKIFYGGFVPTSATMFAGAPGCGKTTLLLQIGCKVAEVTGKPTYLISAEQDKGEIKMTIDRLKLPIKPGMFRLLKAMGSGGSIDEDVLKKCPPGMFILDSLTALCGKDLRAQVDVGREYKRLAVKWHAPAFIICHITKQGDAAGLTTSQHDVDAIMSLFPNDNDRSKFSGKPVAVMHKNRFGATNVDYQLIMKSTGLIEAPKKDGKYVFDATCLDEVVGTKDDLHEGEEEPDDDRDRGRVTSISSRRRDDEDLEGEEEEELDEEEENEPPSKKVAKKKPDVAKKDSIARDIRAVVPAKVPMPETREPHKPTAAERAAETYRRKFQDAEKEIEALRQQLAGKSPNETLEVGSKTRHAGAVKSTRKSTPKKPKEPRNGSARSTKTSGRAASKAPRMVQRREGASTR